MNKDIHIRINNDFVVMYENLDVKYFNKIIDKKPLREFFKDKLSCISKNLNIYGWNITLRYIADWVEKSDTCNISFFISNKNLIETPISLGFNIGEEIQYGMNYLIQQDVLIEETKKGFTNIVKDFEDNNLILSFNSNLEKNKSYSVKNKKIMELEDKFLSIFKKLTEMTVNKVVIKNQLRNCGVIYYVGKDIQWTFSQNFSVDKSSVKKNSKYKAEDINEMTVLRCLLEKDIISNNFSAHEIDSLFETGNLEEIMNYLNMMSY